LKECSFREPFEEAFMSRYGLVSLRLISAATLSLVLGVVPARAGEDPRTAMQFLEGLRERGYHDLAIDFIDQLKADPSTPAETRTSLEYEEGKTRIDEAAKTGDLVRRRELLDQARATLETFVKAHPEHPSVRDSLVQIARMLVERGHLALLLADDTQDAAQKAARTNEARDAFARAREAFGKAVEQLEKAYKGFSGYIPPGDPRLAERDGVYSAMLDAKLQRGVSEYELAQTFPQGSGERTSHLEKALGEFTALYRDYRTQMAGLTAQMWQAKCYEEQGKLGEAIGIYKILLEQPDPRLRPLQRFVGYFHIVALSKRKEYALAADEATRWLEKYNRREELRSQEGLGVLLELARNIDAQMGEVTDASLRKAAARRITDAVSQVVRYTSPHKNEALALLRKYKPSIAARAEEVARMSYDDAMAQADEAIASRDWERSISLLKAAVQKADPLRDIDKANRARYNLAFCFFMNKQYYEADVLAEHLARRYPQGGLSPKATEIGMQALADAYNTFTERDRASDLQRLIDLAKYTASAYADRDQGDDAHMSLGQIDQGLGHYEEAIAEFSAVRDRSPRKLEARTRMGTAHWTRSRALEARGEKEKASEEAGAAIKILQETLAERRASGAGPTDPSLMGNVADLAVALTEVGKTGEALELLDPVVKAQTTPSGPAYSRLMEATLLSQVHAGQVEKALESMKALEKSGGAARGQLYVQLGKLLEREIDRLTKAKDAKGLERMRESYRGFLTALTESKVGQTYQSLEWAGEGLLTLGSAKEAEAVLRRVLTEASTNADFLKESGSKERLLRTRLKLTDALLGQASADRKKLDEASSMVEQLLSEYPKYVDPIIEKGLLLETQAEVERGAGERAAAWGEAIAHWQSLAQRLGGIRPRPHSYFDAWYHAALCHSRRNEATQARQILRGIMRLNPEMGDAEMKAKYQQLLSTLK
jgi:tetratricopeptide (TPR) repeat protein